MDIFRVNADLIVPETFSLSIMDLGSISFPTSQANCCAQVSRCCQFLRWVANEENTAIWGPNTDVQQPGHISFNVRNMGFGASLCSAVWQHNSKKRGSPQAPHASCGCHVALFVSNLLTFYTKYIQGNCHIFYSKVMFLMWIYINLTFAPPVTIV